MKLIEFKTPDNIFLPGLLYEPKKKTRKVAILLHGNGSSSVFYNPKELEMMARSLNGRGISYFPFNNRGAHSTHKIKVIKHGKEERIKAGTSHELIKDCIKDIDGAIKYLTRQSYNEFYLIGFSTGANKICVYNYYKPRNKVSKYVMVGGGDDTGIYYDMLGHKKFNLALKKAKQRLSAKRGADFAPLDLIGSIMSYQSIYDMLNPDGNYNTFPFYEVLNKTKLTKKKKLFREYKSIKKPTLVIYGSDDEYCYGKVSEIVDMLKKEISNPDLFTSKIIKGADHGISGYGHELAKIVSNWLSK